jgi:hypothetical protein
MKPVDELLDKLRKLTDKNQISSLLREFYKAVLKGAEIPEELWEDNLVNTLFKKELDHNKKRFIAICLLRLLNVNNNPSPASDHDIKGLYFFPLNLPEGSQIIGDKAYNSRFYEELLKQEGIELRPQEKEHERRRFVIGAIKESKEEGSRDGIECVRKGNGNKDRRSDSVWIYNEDSFSNNIL